MTKTLKKRQSQFCTCMVYDAVGQLVNFIILSTLVGLFKSFLKQLYDFMFGWVYGISTFVGYLMPNPFLYKSVLFQTIQFSISTQFTCQNSFILSNLV